MKLDKRILLKKYIGMRAPNGQVMEAWSCCQTVDARIDRPTGEVLAAAKLAHRNATAVLTIKSFAGVAPKWRAIWRNSGFSVLAVTPGKEAGTTILYCSEF